MVNHLIHETSPYLLQHAHNPVLWYSWNNKSLLLAKNENKPIFLSIGYSSCHWCHVMAHESFENEDIAKIMNKYFINIKVDREERPDIDDIYQKVCQSSIGQGGWPLSVFLTPDQKPFYIATYIPLQKSYGRPSFAETLKELAKKWNENKYNVEQIANNMISNIQLHKSTDNKIDKSILDEAFVNLSSIFDYFNGGFGTAPKFPNVMNLLFILRYSRLCGGVSKFNSFVFKTLDKMASGGIFDKLDGGFHRYSTDEKWFAPHFEKMLYDNALVPLAYIEAYQITKKKQYMDILLKTMNYVLHRLRSPEGGFYCSQDADYDYEEGKYYLWDKKEIVNAIKDHEIFCTYYNITDGGNFNAKNILYNTTSFSFLAAKFGISENDVKKIIRCGEDKLLTLRMQRQPPFLDDKIITSWNSLMITTLTKTYCITKQKKFMVAAKDCIHFIINKLIKNKQLFHTYKNRTTKISGYLEDYSYFINSLLDFFEIAPSLFYLNLAHNLANYMIKHFWNNENHNFFLTSDLAEKLIIRPQNNYDLSLPSGNSVAAYALLRLYHLTGTKIFYDISNQILEANCIAAIGNPFAYGHLLNTMYMYVKKPIELVVMNNQNNNMIDLINESFIPELIYVYISNQHQLNDLVIYPFFNGKIYDANTTTVYACKNFVCSSPIKNINDLKSYLV